MRKISELLPIVRRQLMSADNANGDEYICYAVTSARVDGHITEEEDTMLRLRVYGRMDAQNPDNVPNVMLIDCLRETGVMPKLLREQRIKVSDPGYWPYRDKWLDDWQAELDRTHICPAEPRHEGDLKGCGLEFEAEPDSEGLVDCPHCGMWHKVTK